MGPPFFYDMAATINATLKSATANSYVTLAEADTYFETVPDSTQWDNKSDDKKNRALISATRWIDTLNFYGDRCDADQALSWPRNNYHVDRVELTCSEIPNDIKYATYELANALANDTDAITGSTGDTGLYKSVKLGEMEIEYNIATGTYTDLRQTFADIRAPIEIISSEGENGGEERRARVYIAPDQINDNQPTISDEITLKFQGSDRKAQIIDIRTFGGGQNYLHILEVVF